MSEPPFPSIGPKEMRDYIAIGRAAMAERKARQNTILSIMKSESQQWIPLTGPGGRLPTRDDADNDGCVYYLDDAKTTWRALWSSCNGKGITNFCPIPKAPPLPKPVEKTQHDLDWDKATEFINNHNGDRANLMLAIRYGRSDGRAQLAREALGLFDKVSIEGMKYSLRDSGCTATLYAIEHLHELLTKAGGG